MNRKPLTVQQFMTRSPHCIDSDSSLLSASKMMHDLDIRHLPVKARGTVAGILSQQNVMAALALPLSGQLGIEDVMVSQPYVVDREADLAEVAHQMASEKFGSAIIIEDGEIVGIFTTIDACRALCQILEDGGR